MTCALCNRDDVDRFGNTKHEGWCPLFLTGPDPGGDPHEWDRLPGLDYDPNPDAVHPADGYADGGTPYTAEELQTVDGLRHGDELTIGGARFRVEMPFRRR